MSVGLELKIIKIIKDDSTTPDDRSQVEAKMTLSLTNLLLFSVVAIFLYKEVVNTTNKRHYKYVSGVLSLLEVRGFYPHFDCLFSFTSFKYV